MAMFDKEEKTAAGPGTVIGSNVKLVGALRDVNDVVVHGVIEGEVGSEKNVTIGESAQVKGPVIGAVVTIAGVVRGDVEAVTRLEITPTGKLHGNIVTCDLVIHSGALFVGKSTMSEEEMKSIDKNKLEPLPETHLVDEKKKPNYEAE